MYEKIFFLNRVHDVFQWNKLLNQTVNAHVLDHGSWPTVLHDDLDDTQKLKV